MLFCTWLADAILPSGLYLIINTISSIVLYVAGVSSSCIVYFIVFPEIDVSKLSIVCTIFPSFSVVICFELVTPEFTSSFVIVNFTPAIDKFVVLSYLYKPIFKSFGIFIICILICLVFIYDVELKLFITSFPFIIL